MSRPEMTDELYLVLDVGTHATRCALIRSQRNDKPSVVFIEKQSYELNRISEREVEQNPEAILQACKDTIGAALNFAQGRYNISHAGIAIQRSTVVAWNAEGKSLYPALSWQDTRGVDITDKLKSNRVLSDKIKHISGLPVSPHYGATKVAWLHDVVYTSGKASISNVKNETKAELEPFYCAPLISYLLFNLLEGKPYLCDESNVGRTQLFDIHERQWSEELCSIFTVPIDSLPRVKPVASHFGVLDLSVLSHFSPGSPSNAIADISLTSSQNEKGIPVNVVCGDQNSAYNYMDWLAQHISLGGVNNKKRCIAVNAGSGGFVLTRDSGKQNKGIAETDVKLNKDRFLQSLVYSDNNSTHYVLEGTVNGVGTALSFVFKQWLELLDESEVNQDVSVKEKEFFKCIETWSNDFDGSIVFKNTIGGLGSPYWKSGDAPCYFSINDASDENVDGLLLTEKSCIKDENSLSIDKRSVAVLESVVFMLALNIENMLSLQGISFEEKHTNNASILIAGGVSRSDYLCQSLATICNITVSRVINHDATALGVATLLFQERDEKEFRVNSGIDEKKSSEAPIIFSPSNNNKLTERYRYFKTMMNTLYLT